MYTEKVMEHFASPHNYGRMENPDGIGKVGNVVCLPPNQKIHINNDIIEIHRISKKDRALSHEGRYECITKAVRRDYNGNLTLIKNKLGTIMLTPEHLVLAIKIPKGDNFLRTRYRKKLTSAWYHAYQLKKGDVALYPILKAEKNVQYIEIDIPKPKWDFKSKELPEKIPVNSDLLRLFGYFLAEGNIQDKPSSTFISFTLNIKEKDIVADITKISKKLFGLDAVVREIPKRKTAVVTLYSAKLARFFKKLFGNGAANKAIPDFIMNLPVEKQKSLIYGLWKGDGYVNLNRDGARAGYSTISYNLAQQVKILLLRQKIAPSIYKEPEKKVRSVKHKRAYRIHVGQRDSLIRLCSILNIKYKPKSYPSEKAWFDDNYLYMSITGIATQPYAGKVYNLEVQDVHSFTSEAFALHNCGDVMWLYIKVGKNEKREEIIKDIKFETFGCVAAIATSSVITDLAKGKTLEEAYKIDKREIVNSLGGLPPIKLHCSVLASDALVEAIYDYYSKNKRQIPKELQEKHERIQKEKEFVEEKYGNWVKAEEKVHEEGKMNAKVK